MPTETNHTIVKSTVEVYKIRRTSDGYWADIAIDSNGRAHRIYIESDYDSWSDYCTDLDTDIKTFLSQMSYDCAADRFDVEERIDVNATVKLWKELACVRRRDKTIDAATARAIWCDIKEMSHVPRYELLCEFGSTSFLAPFIYEVCGVPELSYAHCPRFTIFWKEIWPVLLAEFVREKESINA